jgi:hypothetical protein
MLVVEADRQLTRLGDTLQTVGLEAEGPLGLDLEPRCPPER